MKISDFEISNHDKLDRILVKLCSLIVLGQRQDQDLGMVAAAVLDPDNNCVAATSYNHKGKWTHAEKAAMENYHARFGDIPEGSIILTTLTPCSQPMNDRYGSSCEDLIDDSVVHKVYCGYKDPTQPYGHKKFHTEVTRNKKIQTLCKAFADTFLRDELDEGAAEHVRMVMSSAADLMKQHGFRAVGQLSEKDLNKIAQQTGATLHDVCIILNIDHVDQQLDELSFLGSPCTKDCSGHRAGYAWSQSKGGRVAQSPFSPSFNKGSQLHVDGK